MTARCPAKGASRRRRLGPVQRGVDLIRPALFEFIRAVRRTHSLRSAHCGAVDDHDGRATQIARPAGIFRRRRRVGAACA